MRLSREFVDQVGDAYAQLYDLAYLRSHPLTDLLIRDPALAPRDKAWQLHHLLLEVIGELAPGPQVPVFSRQWRRHRLLYLRYAEAQEPAAIMEELGISRRHYYREHGLAMEALASLLWERCQASAADMPALPQAVDAQASLSQLELLRLEAARLAQASRYASMNAVLQGVLPLLRNMLSERCLDLRVTIPEDLPAIAIDQGMLRQLLLSIMEYVIKYVARSAIRLTAQVRGETVLLTVHAEPVRDVGDSLLAEAEERLSGISDMAALWGARLQVLRAGLTLLVLDLDLPVTQRVVLVVDDNQDALDLFRRYLSANHYQVVTASSAHEALELARRVQPYALTLDLMMPEQDGWDLLQLLLSQPDTRQIPIIVCTVLKQKDLALSLGAAAFLEKPVSEQTLLDALAALHQV